MLDLKGLSFFVEVAERQNLTRAAEALHISQSALTRQIQALEVQMDLKLFDRLGKRLVLTAAGQDLLPRAAALLDHAHQLTTRVHSLSHGHVGLLRIGASPHTIEALLSGVLLSFRQRYPAIETTLLEGPNETLIAQVRSGASHVAIAAPVDDEDLVCQELFWATLHAVVPPGSPWLGRTRIEVTELTEAPLLMLRKGFLTRSLLDRACAQAGIRVRSVLESDSAYALIALAQAGHGTAIVSTTALARAHHDAIPVTHLGAPIRHPVSAVWNQRRHRQLPLVAFIDAFTHHMFDPGNAPHLERHPALLARSADSAMDARQQNARGGAGPA